MRFGGRRCRSLAHLWSRENRQEGDLLFFNNVRVLHARTSFDPTKVDRHLQGLYTDHDAGRRAATTTTTTLADGVAPRSRSDERLLAELARGAAPAAAVPVAAVVRGAVRSGASVPLVCARSAR